MRKFISPIAISRCFSNGKMRALRWGMPAIQSFRDLLVWRKAMDLACRTYSAAQKLPRNEQAVLGYQLRKIRSLDSLQHRRRHQSAASRLMKNSGP